MAEYVVNVQEYLDQFLAGLISAEMLVRLVALETEFVETFVLGEGDPPLPRC